MLERTLTVKLNPGLQARPAAHFVQEATKYKSNVFLEKDGKKVNAKSIMGLMSLAVAQGEIITLITDGPDETEALNHLVAFVEKENM